MWSIISCGKSHIFWHVFHTIHISIEVVVTIWVLLSYAGGQVCMVTIWELKWIFEILVYCSYMCRNKILLYCTTVHSIVYQCPTSIHSIVPLSIPLSSIHSFVPLSILTETEYRGLCVIFTKKRSELCWIHIKR